MTDARAARVRELLLSIYWGTLDSTSREEIPALVDNDVGWERAEIVVSLLASFEEEDIGLVGSRVNCYLPLERQDPAVVTPWDVAARRLRANPIARMQVAYAADIGIDVCVSGVTMLARG
ncbi:hypothetical protein PG995_008794 [Apiospora arundinis]